MAEWGNFSAFVFALYAPAVAQNTHITPEILIKHDYGARDFPCLFRVLRYSNTKINNGKILWVWNVINSSLTWLSVNVRHLLMNSTREAASTFDQTLRLEQLQGDTFKRTHSLPMTLLPVSAWFGLICIGVDLISTGWIGLELIWYDLIWFQANAYCCDIHVHNIKGNYFLNSVIQLQDRSNYMDATSKWPILYL